MSDVIAYMPAIFNGMLVTIAVAICSLALAVLLGLVGAWGKLAKSLPAKKTADAYTTLVRGIPDLVLMLLLFYGGQQLLNDLGDATGWWGYLEIDQFTAGVFTIGFIYGAYMTETFRGAFLSIPNGQIEAGIASGMSPGLRFRRIVWPQLVRYALPSFGNNWLVLLKGTALVSVLGLHELVWEAFTAGRSTRQLFTFFFVVLMLYLVLTAISDVGLRYLERKYSVGVRRA
ncbi:MAG: ABC transporter permease subunit [Kiloniellales bacterium]|nr:ABC transporter permease subunit [Kiloniellales bacterium]